MLILSPEERAQAWHDAVSAAPDERDYKRRILASVAFQMVGSELSLYSDDYAAASRDSFDLLEQTGLIGRDELRQAFEDIDEGRGTTRAFAAALARHLREASTVKRLGRAERESARMLAELWRAAAVADVEGEVDDDNDTYVTVAEVAAVYDVTPQAVYKWIHKGVIEARERPGGSYRIPISALERDARFDITRARRLQQELVRRHEDQNEIETDEMVATLRSRRARSR